MSTSVKKRVCVSGVNGFVGAQVAKDLLESGYGVNGTVRSLSDCSLAHLTCLTKAEDSFRDFEADLLVPDSFDEAARGCDYAVHCASPSSMDHVADAEKELVDPAVEGTLSFLESCRKSGSVKKVVMTGCSTAITDEGTSGVVLDEEVWNDKSSLTRQPYFYGKTLAEKRAWKWADENEGMKLVVINPTGIIGPSLVEKVSTTTGLLKAILEGQEFPGIVDMSWSFVDVRDVSRAHIAALESDSASGRYICADTENVLHMREVVSVIGDMGYAPNTVRARKYTHGLYIARMPSSAHLLHPWRSGLH
jgi:dihydroflavonol-4-reductase